MALVPLNVFVTHDGKSKRQHVTCRYKCGDACSKPAPNTSDNEYFGGSRRDGAHLTLLDEGTLYVAKLSSDIAANEIDGSGKLPSKGSFSGSGTWIPLLRSGPNGQAESLVDGVTAQEVAVFTRLAADKAGATKMDRPEDFEANPKTGKVYVALTNNDERGAPGEARPDAANPRNDNKSGQVLEITDTRAGTDFT